MTKRNQQKLVARIYEQQGWNKSQAKKMARREHKGMLEVTAQHDCGCCFCTMYFKDRGSAERAFAKAGLQNSATITDDEGTEHTGIDTFYGFSTDPKEFERSPLLRLAEKVGFKAE